MVSRFLGKNIIAERYGKGKLLSSWQLGRRESTERTEKKISPSRAHPSGLLAPTGTHFLVVHSAININHLIRSESS